MMTSPLLRRGGEFAALAASKFQTNESRKNAGRHATAVSLFAAFACATGITCAAGFTEIDLVANKKPLTDANGIVHNAANVDVNLQNPWGVGASATSPFWVSDNGAGVSTLYNAAGTPQFQPNPLVVSIPGPDDATGLGNDGTPTGLVFNITFNPATMTGAFPISGFDKTGAPITAPAVFLFATEDGTILGWNPNVGPGPAGSVFTPPSRHAIIAVNRSPSGAVYKGLAITMSAGGAALLYATNFHAATVDVYDGSFHPASTLVPKAFTDPNLPKRYAPFNIVPVNGMLFVTYAVQDSDAHDDVAGMGHGIVDTYSFDGQLTARFAQHGQLNSPWGIAVAPASFGGAAGKLLIGNFGNGQINIFDPVSGEFLDKLRNSHGQAIVIDGLWTLRVGSGNANGGDSTKVYFTAGPNDESDGLFGSLSPSE